MKIMLFVAAFALLASLSGPMWRKVLTAENGYVMAVSHAERIAAGYSAHGRGLLE